MNRGRGLLLISLCSFAVPAFLSGCASAPRYPAGEAILKGETPRFPPAPDSLRASLDLTAFSGGRKSTVSAAFSAKPGLSYKLDLFGLPGMVAGSFLWTPERWTLVLFEPEEYVEGSGEHVDIGNLGLREASVHDLFSFLWGDFFPGDRPQGAAGAASVPEGLQSLGNGAFEYAGPGASRWRVNLDEKTGLAREALSADSAFRIVYSGYRSRGSADKGRPVPHSVRLYRRGETVLEIQVKTIEDDPHWRRNPFSIKVPKGFTRLERVAPEPAPK